ncbi:SDR family NAD(P)-dependent oxidoreductase [Rhodococcoides kyotonense]|uniref:NAD(P)-dependent dehydrogenase, short-chain alcohol dehydrogenase family n=1 Tax=Rhodococcoides kyotonense TaxID=398843 RepID=A0A239IKZ7_9NOCA|nr:SDR family NAD(P)-dependent oxidoreductase [Rhodococcus kyotonensis]SNS94211.1 NAD(P)-dependent dehydrogenase, short-chain alcohol dehydrogenase family [Rhodococcus kyotonensis]
MTRTALITGGAQGLGLSTAKRLGEDGFHVVVADIVPGLAGDAVDKLTAEGITATAATVDVTDDASVEECLELVDSVTGGLDVLVNNAGIISRSNAEDTESGRWERELSVHLGGAMRCSRAAFGQLVKSSSPAIVNLASVGSTFGLPHRLAYSTAKTGVVGMTRTLAAEWGRRGIRVNAVAPGYMDTGMMQSGIVSGTLDRDRILMRTPLMRFGRPEEVASAISFLVSADASFVTGVVLEVDGGITIDGTFHADDSYKSEVH